MGLETYINFRRWLVRTVREGKMWPQELEWSPEDLVSGVYRGRNRVNAGIPEV